MHKNKNNFSWLVVHDASRNRLKIASINRGGGKARLVARCRVDSVSAERVNALAIPSQAVSLQLDVNHVLGEARGRFPIAFARHVRATVARSHCVQTEKVLLLLNALCHT